MTDKKKPKKYARAFGKKEKILNYASSTYQLTRPSKVDAVMSLIRACQPKELEEWKKFYFEKAYTKDKTKINKASLDELGERLYAKITEVVIPEWTAAFEELTLQDCKDYIYEVTIVRTYDGFITEKSVIYDVLAKKIPEITFEESDPELDHAGDIDYLGIVGEKAFGIQIKPTTINSNFGNYNPTDRMKTSFQTFKEKYGGEVFVIYSIKQNNKKIIQNMEIVDKIKAEVKRLKNT